MGIWTNLDQTQYFAIKYTMQSKAVGRVFDIGWQLGNRNNIVAFSKSSFAIEFLLKLLQRFHRFVSKNKFVERQLFRRMWEAEKSFQNS